MELNQKTLRGILAQILSVDEKFVVPKQGNWWNPQEKEKINNWCAYRIKSNRAKTAPFFCEIKNKNCVGVEKIATIELQFVGKQSEEIAQSVSNWTLREDVKNAFQKVQGSIMYSGSEAISSVFSQEGNNTILAWNVDIQVLWISVLETNQRTINIGG